ncbi:MAG TPA: response regulator [Methylomirabilota bacterium]|jgi:DNA-binding response OmpR family regulator|nr:response regulator [Methylomirabilota bacterium]
MAEGRLLVVDDEREITAVLEEHFRAAGYAVDVAHSGSDALLMAAARRPDAVLLDVTMPPGPDGAEVLSRLRALDPTVAVVMLTGNGDVELARSLLRAGAFDYVPKPFELDVLERVVAAATALGRRA